MGRPEVPRANRRALGQHALAYSLLGFFGIAIHRRVLWFGLSGQMAQVAPAFFAATLLTLLVLALSQWLLEPLVE